MAKRPPRPNILPVAILIVGLVVVGWLGCVTKNELMVFCLPVGVMLCFFSIAYYFAWTPHRPKQD